MHQMLLFPSHPPAEVRGLLTAEEQCALVDKSLAGDSPQSACRRLGLAHDAFVRTVEADAEFRRELHRARESLTANVTAVVYRAAMKGTPAAQALWLRTFPPPAYDDVSLNPATPSSSERIDDLSTLSTDAIERQLQAYRAAVSDGDGCAAEGCGE